MINNLAALQFVKIKREESALEALRETRRQLSQAIELRDGYMEKVDASARKLVDQETEFYGRIMHKVVRSEDVDLVKGKLYLAHKAHRQLEDNLEIASQQCHLLDKQASQAHREYLSAQRKSEKIAVLVDQLTRGEYETKERREEAEREEQHSTRMGANET